MVKYILFIVLIVLGFNTQAQVKKSILFIGNSYIGVNNLPLITQQVATAMGDTLNQDSNTPGGTTFNQHTTNATTLAKIALGTWDYVALQEQSQLPSFPDGQVQADTYPYAKRLDSLITAYNSCTETVFYMTWGRKNGDAANCPGFPPLCTYSGMDSLLRLRYMIMAQDNKAIVSPVGAVWRYIRNNYPAINLYQADESHPTMEGSYAAACAFYTVVFRKDISTLTFDATLSASDAANIRTAVKKVVFDSLQYWNVGKYDPIANFTFTKNNLSVSFNNTSTLSANYTWYFGDGNTSNSASPSHTYTAAGIYTVVLVSSKCGIEDSMSLEIVLQGPNAVNSLQNKNISITPNPASDLLFVNCNTCNYCIYNTHGELVSKNNMQGAINISQLKPNTYFIKIEDQQGYKFTSSFIKQ
jgi:hypothetical protein